MQLVFPTEPIPLLFLASYLLAGGISSAIAYYSYRSGRDQPTARAFAVVSIMLACWAFGYVGRMLTPTLAGKLLWTQVAWIGITIVPVAVLVFVLVFTGRGTLLTRTRVAALLVVPFLTQGVLATNEHHALFYRDVWLHVGESIPFIASRGGLWFYGIHSPYAWLLFFVATVLLVQFAIQQSPLFRLQSLILTFGAIFPLVVNASFISGLRVHPELDPTPVGFAIGMAVIGFAAYRLEFLGLIPVARDRVLDEIDDCIFVLDEDNRLIDVNESGGTFLERFTTKQWSIGDSAKEVFPPALVPADEFDGRRGGETEVRVSTNALDAWYILHVYALRNPIYQGRIITLTDISIQKHQQRSLERASERIETERDGKEAIGRLLLETSTDQEVANTTCRLLVETYGYEAAWIVQTGARSDIRIVASRGDHHGFWRAPGDGQPLIEVVARRTLETGETISETVDATDETELGTRLRECGLHSIRSISLEHDGISSGALIVARTAPVAEFSRNLVDEFAAAIAFKQQVHRQQDTLVAEAIVELTIRITDTHFLAALSRAPSIPNGGQLVAHEVQRDEQTVTYLIETSDVDAETLAEAADGVPEIRESVSITDGDPSVVRVRVDHLTLGTVLVGYGGAIRSIIAGDGRVDLTVQFPRLTEIATAAEAIQSHWPDATVLSQIERTKTVDRPALFEALTDKQERALRAATVAGFFDRPQRANASDVAETLDISRSTFLNHVRSAERKVFESAFRDELDTP